MIRTVLASPWLPLLYWAAAVVAMICGARHESLRRRLGHHEFQAGLRLRTNAWHQFMIDASTSTHYPAKPALAAVQPPTRFWYPQIFVFQRTDFLRSEAC